jgi:hypothetical protein
MTPKTVYVPVCPARCPARTSAYVPTCPPSYREARRRGTLESAPIQTLRARSQSGAAERLEKGCQHVQSQPHGTAVRTPRGSGEAARTTCEPPHEDRCRPNP